MVSTAWPFGMRISVSPDFYGTDEWDFPSSSKRSYQTCLQFSMAENLLCRADNHSPVPLVE